MIYVIERNGKKEKVIIPDTARPATNDDMAYFQAKADEETAIRNQYILQEQLRIQIANKRAEISSLKRKLSDTDYKLLKLLEGELAETEYATCRKQRKEWRATINTLEVEIGELQERINYM